MTNPNQHTPGPWVIVRKPDGRGREVTARRLTGRSY